MCLNAIVAVGIAVVGVAKAISSSSDSSQDSKSDKSNDDYEYDGPYADYKPSHYG